MELDPLGIVLLAVDFYYERTSSAIPGRLPGPGGRAAVIPQMTRRILFTVLTSSFCLYHFRVMFKFGTTVAGPRTRREICKLLVQMCPLMIRTFFYTMVVVSGERERERESEREREPYFLISMAIIRT